MVAMVGLVLDDVRRGSGGWRHGVFRVTAVEIAVAAACSAF